MIIRTANKDVHVIAVYDDIMKQGVNTYPALRFEFENEVPAEDVTALMEGNFTILNDLNEELGVHEGYNTLKNISVSIGKITPVEQERDELQETLGILLGGEVE